MEVLCQRYNDKHIINLRRNHFLVKRNWSDIKCTQDISHIDYVNLPNHFGTSKFIPNYNKVCTQFDIMKKLYNIFIVEQKIAVEQLQSYNTIMTNFCIENSIENIFQLNSIEKSSTILTDNSGNLMYIHNDIKILFINNIIYLENMKGDKFFIFSSNLNYIQSGDKKIIFKLVSDSENNKLMLESKMEFRKSRSVPEELRATLNGKSHSNHSNNDLSCDLRGKKSEENLYQIENGNFSVFTKFKNSETGMNVVIYKKIKQNGDREECYNKNGLLCKCVYDNTTKQSVIVSQCMMNNSNSDIRYRGTYKEIRSNGETVKKSLEKDDELIYSKEGGQVLIDKINTKSIKDEIQIVWKVAKSETGEKRIIKLGIPTDAKIVKPICDDFFYTRGKERCDKAFVMDIQYPTKEEESVVPNELVAYSYLYNEHSESFQYRVGAEVIPDSFDENENESCTNGIHFYRERYTIFDMYINH